MIEHENMMLIKEHFAAFGRGDFQQALSMVAENVDWQSPVTRTPPKEITWAAPCHSREEVMQFFRSCPIKFSPKSLKSLDLYPRTIKLWLKAVIKERSGRPDLIMSTIGSWFSLYAMAKSSDTVITMIQQMWHQRVGNDIS